MTRECEVTGKRPVAGNNVSHAKNRTKRRFLTSVKSQSATIVFSTIGCRPPVSGRRGRWRSGGASPNPTQDVADGAAPAP